ncbi:efflux RND transporter permease subunit [Ruminococcus bicirculans (ex Wegman et al. 2014)]|uniref:efflux RND transporter permease subunit n=1 Tax=Ruminococcus bicirculans (ex Wegman et al. 2014) TaxID=1160721 RepID=UPI0016448FDD|nr:MMPL family transporter [Ruminococcus bicirculans (ex Wegman et al. 2014)]MBC3514076.1 MMPL family transporter [Ruminococcus bicirculans (ex Wegman et al. 2014)]
MQKFGRGVVKLRVPILIVSVLLLIPSIFGFVSTRINYDILSYLPSDIETMKGQDIMLDEFGKGGFSLVMLDGMDDKDVEKVKEKIEKVDHVCDVLWYDTLADVSLPKEVLPDDIYDFFNTDNSTMMAVFFDEATSADGSLEAVKEIRSIAGEQCFVSGMSSVVEDIKDLTMQEAPMYVVIAVILTSIILALTMDSFLIPLFFMLSVGMAIIYNMGTNFIQGEISFITEALAAVLQLAVTIDYSIFLWHSYKEEKEKHPGDNKEAMAVAIGKTITSVVSSSITTVAGFLALCFMSYELGMDMGIVMAKGVVIGVICCITVLPSMILVFDKALEKTMHKDLVPSLEKPSKFIIKHHAAFIVLFIVVLIPAVYGQINTNVYYNLTDTLPKDLNSVIANTKLDEEYNMATTHMLLVDADMKPKEVNSMLDEMGKVDGVSFSMSLDTLIGPSIPREIVPESVTKILKSDKWQLMLIGSEYKVASDEENAQIDELSKILKSYDKDGMLIGEAAATKDLIDITDHDFKVVNIVSIAAIFIIILIALRSVSLPIILVAVIEFAITVNMGVPCFTNTTIPFIASVVIGTIQLGATVDYAILMTTRYKTERNAGKDKHEAVTIALSTSMKSIMVSALGFFASTFGVGVYSSVDMISQLCTLMSRGAIISMITVICILPSMLMLFDKVIINTTMGMKKKENKLYKLPEIN